MKARDVSGIQPMGLGRSGIFFGGAALLLAAATHGLIPVLVARTDIEPVLLWFMVGGLGVLTPLVLVGFLMLTRESPSSLPTLWRQRLRLRPMTGSDWLWSVGALALIGLLSAGMIAALRVVWGDVRLQPTFMAFDTLTPDRFWILGAWLPFWLLNITGEEFLWRGVVLPRQEVALGQWAWLANGAGWLLFHSAFGAIILLTLLPIVFILPYVVQRRQNTWTGVVIHAGLNGPGFLAVAFGLV